MTDIENRLRQVLAREAARTQAAMLRTLPDPSISPAPLVPARRVRRPGGHRARRWLAPAGAAVAVVAVISAVSLAGIHGKPATVPAAGGATSGMPRFYVSVVFRPHARAEVHDARTGQVLSSIPLPQAEQGTHALASGVVAAAASDRAFAVAASEKLGHDEMDVRLLMLHVSTTGRTGHFTVTPVRVTSPGSADHVSGIALSPDGSKLAVTIQIPTAGFHPYGEIKVISLAGGFRTRTWTTHEQFALPSDPAWEAGGRYLGFTWEGHVTGPGLKGAGVTQVRLLDTAAPGGNILAAKVLAEDGHALGSIQTALLAPDGRSILVTTFRNVPGGPGQGTAIVKLAQLSVPGGRVARVYRTRSVPYHGSLQEITADVSCGAWAVSAQGQHALASCPGFGRLDGGTFTPLPGVGGYPIVAW
jgi:hypothetical protein